MRHPSIVEPTKQLRGGEAYLHQFSINPKAVFEGELWGWHQGYPTWLEENCMPTPRVINVGLFLDDVTEFNGPLYLDSAAAPSTFLVFDIGIKRYAMSSEFYDIRTSANCAFDWQSGC